MKKDNVLLPDFMIVGAMKCATSTLHDQLALQPGIHMSNPKEPNFFSNDEIYRRGMQWYSSLFRDEPGLLQGESSTHYTKMPTYPETLTRMLKHGLGEVKMIYVIREPVSRLVSQYIHEWSQGFLKDDINTAIKTFPILVDYSRYDYQYSALLEHFKPEQILVVFYEKLIAEPQQELGRICRFIGYQGKPVWNFELEAQNVSAKRIRKFPLYSLIVESPLLAYIRRTFVPKSLREAVKDRLVMKQRPELSPESLEQLRAIFDADLKQLGAKLGLPLSIDSYKKVALGADSQAGRTAVSSPTDPANEGGLLEPKAH